MTVPSPGMQSWHAHDWRAASGQETASLKVTLGGLVQAFPLHLLPGFTAFAGQDKEVKIDHVHWYQLVPEGQSHMAQPVVWQKIAKG